MTNLMWTWLGIRINRAHAICKQVIALNSDSASTWIHICNTIFSNKITEQTLRRGINTHVIVMVSCVCMTSTYTMYACASRHTLQHTNIAQNSMDHGNMVPKMKYLQYTLNENLNIKGWNYLAGTKVHCKNNSQGGYDNQIYLQLTGRQPQPLCAYGHR